MPGFDRSEVKIKIEAEILKTEKQVIDYTELTRPVEPENAIGRISRMDAINNKSVTEAALRKAKEKLEKLHFALAKINDPEFGVCIKCRQPIPLGRILIMPQSQTCVNCSN
ncbi:MAG TPA: TraR/DksA C4-type zinc finger protein [Draconibacterium sp.]|nr:TraR/DksA C4-type zinc finger protein [Draconibacterium sp.]